MRVGGTSRPTFAAPAGAGRGRTTWSPPYALPNAGQVVSISTNFASSVKPTTHSASDWNYAVFGYFGGGALVEDYSRAGGYVIAGTGGHQVPPNLGACIFDFEDATWKRLDNANGVPQQDEDFEPEEIETLFGEILAPGSPTTSTGCPCPSHLYAFTHQLRSSQGGGQKGSFMRLRGLSGATDASRGSDYAHKIDLATGLWTRVSTNGYVNQLEARVSQYDPVTRRFYQMHQLLHAGLPLQYVDESDWTWKTDSIANPGDIGSTFGAFVDQARRLLVVSTSNDTMHAFNMDSVGVLTELTLSGSLVAGRERYQWQLYPADGCYYRFAGTTTSTTIEKLKPPPLGTDPLTEDWTASTVTVGTALTQQPAAYITSGAVHYNRFFYVPMLGCFAWVPGGDEPVVLLKPPA